MSRRLVKLIVTLAILVALAVVADRVSVSLAQSAATKWLAGRADFVGSPKVQIHGFPFLTQAAQGKYDDIEVSSSQVRVGGIAADGIDVHLRGVQIPLSSAFSRSVTTVPCDSIAGTVTLPFASVVALTEIPRLSLTWKNGGVAVSANLPVLGKTELVTGVATASLAGNALTLQASRIAVAGVNLPAALVTELAAALAVPIPLPALPFDLKLESVTVGASGVVLRGGATSVVLTGH